MHRSGFIKIKFILLFHWLTYGYIIKFHPICHIKYSICSERKVGGQFLSNFLLSIQEFVYHRSMPRDYEHCNPKNRDPSHRPHKTKL
jgi:hypothetical protein